MLYILINLFLIAYGAWCCFCAEKRLQKRMNVEEPSTTAIRTSQILGVVLMAAGLVSLIATLTRLM